MKKIIILLFITLNIFAQPPQILPLNPPIDPIGNLSSQAKILLGKTLYWDEQLSSTKTVACASCHILSSGGTDPRLVMNPGFDGEFNTADDINGSAGVSQSCVQGEYVFNETYGYKGQVTGRKAPSVINVGYAEQLFWDGRASDQLIDPISNQLVLSSGAALESQILGPLTSSVEMGHTGRNWHDVIDSVEKSAPMALSPQMSGELSSWINSQSYYELFNMAFGSSEITAPRIAMAMASYERSLYSNQSPYDNFVGGLQNSLNQQQRRGLNVFREKSCVVCHTGALLSDNNFHNIGVTPNIEDEGRFIVTGVNADRGRFKTPVLRNLSTRNTFMHSGTLTSLEQVIEFYDRGGDFQNPNLDPRMVPLNMTQNEKVDLLAFLTGGLNDERVINETGPFLRPTLYSESNRVPIITGTGIAGLAEKIPVITAIEPPILGNDSFTVSIENSRENTHSVLVIDDEDPGLAGLPEQSNKIIYIEKTILSTQPDGHASISVILPNDDRLIGTRLYGRWYVEDNQAINGYAISALLEFTLFEASGGHAGKIFSGDFENQLLNCNE